MSVFDDKDSIKESPSVGFLLLFLGWTLVDISDTTLTGRVECLTRLDIELQTHLQNILGKRNRLGRMSGETGFSNFHGP